MAVAVDPDNVVVRLCAAGMAAEGRHLHDEARARYEEAWARRADDFEACIAAHYLAREQDTLVEALAWNEAALAHALRVEPQRVAGFLPSLYLNLGWSHEVLGDVAAAQGCYLAGAAHLADLADVAGPLAGDAYMEVVRDGLARGLHRTEDGG